METQTLTPQEISKVINAFSQMRMHLDKYMKESKFEMSNAQIFTFVLYAPLCLAIASDREIDESEIRLLEKISRNIDVTQAVPLELLEVISIAAESQNVIINEEFNMRVDAELLFLARNIDKYENSVIDACKAMLSLDSDPTASTSITKTFSKWFDFVLGNSFSHRKTEELEQVKAYKAKLGI